MAFNKNILQSAILSGVDPTTGEYLSPAQRKAIFRKRNISSEKVFGKPGAIVKATPSKIVPGVQPLAEPSGSLVKRINILENQVSFLTKSIEKEAEVEKQTQKDIEKTLIKEDEKKARKSKENILEKGLKKIISPLFFAAGAIGGKVKGVLDTILEFFGILFAGWLTDKGLNAIRSFVQGDTIGLEGIKTEVLKTLAIIGGIFLALNGGIFSILGIIGGVIGAVGALGAKILSVASAAAAAIPGVGAVGTLAAGTAAAVGAGLATTKGVTDVARNIVTGGSKFREAQDRAAAKRQQAGVSRLGKVLERRGSRTIETSKERTPEQEKAWQEWQKETKRIDSLRDSMRKEIKIEVAKVKPTGIKTSGRDKGKPYFTAEDVSKKKEIEQQIRSKYEAMLLDPNAKPVVKPVAKTDLLKQKEEDKVDKERQAYLKWLDGRPDEFENQLEWETMKQNGKAPGFSTPSVATPSATETQKSPPPSPIPQITPPSSPSFVPGPASSAQPQIIYKKVPSSAKGQGSSLKSGSATDVPNISSSNPDNFYTLYSQMNYNVVI